jgi:hypothetical protein
MSGGSQYCSKMTLTHAVDKLTVDFTHNVAIILPWVPFSSIIRVAERTICRLDFRIFDLGMKTFIRWRWILLNKTLVAYRHAVKHAEY